MKDRIVVTGMGVVAPQGEGVDAFWGAIKEGESAVHRISRFDPEGYPSQIGAEVRNFDPEKYLDRRIVRKTDRFSHFVLASIQMALENSGLDLDSVDLDQVGVTMGTGIGGLETLTEQYHVMRERGPGRVSPNFVPMMIGNMAAGQAAIYFGLRGPNTTLTTACASAGNAIGESLRILQRGEAEVMFAGGTEAGFVPIAIAGFSAMRALSTRNDEPQRASRPFDAERDGFVMGEGAAVLVLERLEHAKKRGANILAEVVGYGMTADAYHVTAPAPGGEGGARCMQRALADAALDPSEVDYINAHGTSTPPGDESETQAIKTVFGDYAYDLPVSSTKSMTGHLLGASGAIEAVISVMTIQDGVVPPTINYEFPDPACDLDYVPNEARDHQVDVALSNSFGFGGQNATLLFKRFKG